MLATVSVLQHSLTAADAAAEDGELLELTSPCRVTFAERDNLNVKIRCSFPESGNVKVRSASLTCEGVVNIT